MATEDTSTRPIYYALGANGGIAAAKFAAATFTGSGAMLAEATQPSDHALVDAINTVEETIQQRWPQVKWCFFEPDFEPGKD